MLPYEDDSDIDKMSSTFSDGDRGESSELATESSSPPLAGNNFPTENRSSDGGSSTLKGILSTDLFEEIKNHGIPSSCKMAKVEN